MIWNILQYVFCTMPFVLPLALYKSRRPFMTAFYVAMTRSNKARKLYVQVCLILLLLFHYIYTCGHSGQFSILLSTTVCAAMFSFRLTDNCLRRLQSSPRAFVTIALAVLPTIFSSYLHRTAVTASYLLLAAMFYPSVRIMARCKQTDVLSEWAKHPELLSEIYHDHHHAKLPHDADSGNPVTSA